MVEKADIRVCFLEHIFRRFDDVTLTVYERMTEGQKRSYIKQEAHKFLVTKEDSFYSARSRWKSLSDLLPQYKEQITDIFYDYCYEKGVLQEDRASSFIEVVGKSNPRAKYLLNRFTRHCVSYLLISLIMCVGGGLLVFNRMVPGWTMFFLGPIILGGLSMGIQYIFKTLSAFRNYVKKHNFNLDTTTMAYNKVHGTAGGNFKPVSNPIRKKEEKVDNDDGLDSVEL